jgi:beta-glucanase (GH16 family)
MGFVRVRGVGFLVAAVLAATVEVISPASAAVSAPTVRVSQTAEGVVTLTGRTATAHPRVRIDRRTSAGWALVKRVRARHHRYAATLRVAPGATVKFRVTSNHRSRKVRVTAATGATAAKAAPGGKTQYDACGARPRKADGSLWSCTFVDDFAGTALDRTKWVPNTAFVTWSGDTHACYRDDPANVNVANGVLNLSLVKLAAPASCAIAVAPTEYMSGSVSTYHLFSQQYGRYEARIKTTATTSPGLHEAFWLWPDDRYSTINWPDSGEIDVAESFSAYSNIAGSYLHYTSDTSSLLLSSNAKNCAASRGVWNTFTLVWGPSRIETFVNGKSCLVNTSGDPAFQKRYIINLTQAIGGASWNLLGATTPVPATTQVDYVRVWG